ncbi:hypothetical protein WMY93_010423 [Mugilogobius chulae]|uniref:Reverse transcriptase domain-containing protein n=1 Tax=Mugilogobius chulae TaxID=88201 RepID=A0AAW0PB37_9GOBI
MSNYQWLLLSCCDQLFHLCCCDLLLVSIQRRLLPSAAVTCSSSPSSGGSSTSAAVTCSSSPSSGGSSTSAAVTVLVSITAAPPPLCCDLLLSPSIGGSYLCCCDRLLVSIHRRLLHLCCCDLLLVSIQRRLLHLCCCDLLLVSIQRRLSTSAVTCSSSPPNSCSSIYAAVTGSSAPPGSGACSNPDAVPFISVDEVRIEFRRLHGRKSAGPDGISPRLLRECASELAVPLHTIFNKSLQTGCVPALWKTSCLVPVPKTFERLLLRRLKPQVEGALDPLQFAYQDSMGVDDAILYMVHRALSFLDGAGGYVRLMFFDFTSAFDTIQPQLLKGKLERMGVDPVFVRWIHNYLTLRSQYVRLGDCVSGILTSNTGAPQGTVLSPFLFTLYTADFAYTSAACHVQKYSDDTAIVACVKGRDENEYRELITGFTSWSRENGLMLNTSKTKEMIIDFVCCGKCCLLWCCLLGWQYDHKGWQSFGQVIKKCASVIGRRVDSVGAVLEKRMRALMQGILDNPRHPLHDTMSAQRSTRSDRFLSLRCRTARFNSSAPPQSTSDSLHRPLTHCLCSSRPENLKKSTNQKHEFVKSSPREETEVDSCRAEVQFVERSFTTLTTVLRSCSDDRNRAELQHLSIHFSLPASVSISNPSQPPFPVLMCLCRPGGQRSRRCHLRPRPNTFNGPPAAAAAVRLELSKHTQKRTNSGSKVSLSEAELTLLIIFVSLCGR